MPDRLVIPEKLYGREREIDTLLASFERVVTSGTPELVLVSGYSGIGKSSVVNELHKVLVPPRGLFASGKFDQYKLDIPYTTLAQAFQSLVRYLLGKSDAELSGWRDALVEALGPNGPLMIDLVPELKLIIGDQPPVPELPPQDARGRFQVVLRRFIGVFARPDHPLALFIDDLQWLDAATLDLLEDLLTPPGVPHLMLIGAYRDNEVTAAHPLTRKLEAIRNAGANVQEIALAPLASEHVRQLVADALRCDLARAAPLAQLVHGKTAGNPFFLVQFLQTLAEEGWLVFDHEQRAMVLGSRSHPRESVPGQRRRSDGGQVEPPAARYADGVAAARLPREHRPGPDAFPDPREIGRGGRCGSLGGRSSGAGRAPGRLLPVRPRSRSGSRLLVDPGGATRRGAPSNRQTARGPHPSRAAGGGDLRHRQSVQPRRVVDHLARRARAGGRAQSVGRKAR